VTRLYDMPLPDSYTTPVFEPPHRALVLIASTAAWYTASREERASAIEALSALFDRAAARGARLVGSIDDDLFVTGQPSSLPYSIYVLLDVDDPQVAVEMVHELRSSELGTLLRMEIRIGRPLFLLDN
jgi:hypothetical protein